VLFRFSGWLHGSFNSPHISVVLPLNQTSREEGCVAKHAATTVALTWPVSAVIVLTAQAGEEGRVEYLSTRAICRGADGKGRGPMSNKLKVKPADLTLLAKAARLLAGEAWES
jgi:hypothetical protein